MKVPTPHIEAKKGEIAKTVLMPGDPLRAKFIADTFLNDVTQYNWVRGMYGYTGNYKDKTISVQGSGMGCPSMAIYSQELYEGYEVDNIIRVGTCGAIQEELVIGDIILAMGACTNSNYSMQYGLAGTFSPIADYRMLTAAVEESKKMGVKCYIGNIVTSDFFYLETYDNVIQWKNMGCLAFEMETAALYMNAAYTGKNALTILTVVDQKITHSTTTSQERETSFTDMMKIALETAVEIQ
jgi:purine-nucleoside phosphorylase